MTFVDIIAELTQLAHEVFSIQIVVLELLDQALIFFEVFECLICRLLGEEIRELGKLPKLTHLLVLFLFAKLRLL